MHETKIAIKLEEETKGIVKMCEKLTDVVNHELDKGVENIDTKELGEAIDMIKDLYEAKKELVEACYYVQIMESMEKAEEEGDEGEEMDDMRRGYRGQPRDSMGRYMSRRGRGGRGRGRRRGYEEPMEYMVPEIYGYEEAEMYRDMDMMNGRMYFPSGSGGSSGSSGGSSGGRGGSGGGGSQGGSSGGSGGGQGGSSGGSAGGGGSRGYSESSRQSEGGNYSTRMQDGGRDSREGKSGQSRRSYMEAKEMNKGNSQQEKQEKMKELEKYMGELSGDITEMISDASPEEKAMLKNKLQGLIQKV